MPPKNEAVLKFRVDLTQLRAGLARASVGIKTFASSASASAALVAKSFTRAGMAISAFGAKITALGAKFSALSATAMKTSIAIAMMLAPAILQGSKFEQNMSAVKAVVTDLGESIEGSSKRFETLNNLARQLGETTKFSASQVAEGMKFLGMAGLSTNQILVATRSTLNLAAAGMLELGRAADIATDTMSGLGMAAGDIARIADVLALTAASANTNIEMMGETMKYAAPIAGAVGQSIEQVAAMAGVLANAGIKASSAGTGLAGVMAVLAKGGDQVSGILGKVGITLDDVNPALWSMAQIMQRLHDASFSAGEMMTMFGRRAGRSALILAQNVDQVKSLAESLDDAAGKAMKMAEVMQSNVRGEFTILLSAIEGMNISFFEEMKVELVRIIRWLKGVVTGIREWAEANKPLVQAITKILILIAGLGALLTVVATTISLFASVIGGAISAIGTVVAGVVAIISAKLLIIVAIISAVLLPIIYAIVTAWEDVKALAIAMWKNAILPLWNGLKAAAMWAWSVIKPLFDMVVTAVQDLIASLRRFWESASWVKPVIMAIAKAIGIVLALPVIAFFAVVAIALRIVVGLMQRIVDLGVGIANFFGAGIETSSEQTARLAMEAKKASQELAALTEAAKGFAEDSIKMIAAEEKLIELLTKKGKLEAVELDRLAELRASYDVTQKSLDDRVVSQQREVNILTKAIKKAEEYGEETTEQRKVLDVLQASLERATASQDRWNVAVEEGTLREVKSAEEYKAMANAIRDRATNTRLLEEATSRLSKTLTELDRIEKELRESTSVGLTRELEKVEELRSERKALMMIRLADLEAQRKATVALGDETAEMDKQILNIRELLRLADQRAAAERTRLILAQKRREADFARDSDIAQAKRAGDRVRAAQLEAAKMIQVEGEKIDKLFELDKARGDEEKKRVAVRARDIVRAAIEAEEAERDPLVGAAEREKEIEKSATDQVISRVRSVRDLIILYQVLAMIREAQEERARQAAVKAVQSGHTIAALEARRDKARTEAERLRLQNLIDIKKAELNLQQGVAAKRAGEAGLEGAQGNMIKDERRALLANLQGLEDAANTIKVRLNEILGDGMRIPVENLVKTWIDGAVNTWVIESERLLSVVRTTMEIVKQEMSILSENANVWFDPNSPMGRVASGGARVAQDFGRNIVSGPNLDGVATQPAAVAAGGGDTVQNSTTNTNQEIVINLNDYSTIGIARDLISEVLGITMDSGDI